MTIGKTIALTRWIFVGKVMSLLFNMLSRLDITLGLERSLEGLMLKLQYFDHLMRRADSLEKTLILGKIQGGRRRRRQSQLNRHESGQTPGIDDGQGGLEWSSPWVTKSQIGLSS